MAFCGNCGNELQETDCFCAECGQSSDTRATNKPDPPPLTNAPSAAEIHLKRACDLFEQLDTRQKAAWKRLEAHQTDMDRRANSDSGSFVVDMAGIVAGGVKGKNYLARDRSSLLSEVNLIQSELDKANEINPDARILINDLQFDIPSIQAGLYNAEARIESIWGSKARAKHLLVKSISIFEEADDHYLLGLLYEEEYQPQEALKHFERYLELAPNGADSTAALREAQAMRNYKKRFRGSWILLIFLLFIYIFPGVIYWIKKYK